MRGRLQSFGGKAGRVAVRLPATATRGIAKLIVRLVGTWLLVTRDALPCSGCGEPVSLVGRWQCGWCDYVFDGFAFVRCEVCGAVPPFIECQACGVGIKNPMLFGSGRRG